MKRHMVRSAHNVVVKPQRRPEHKLWKSHTNTWRRMAEWFRRLAFTAWVNGSRHSVVNFFFSSFNVFRWQSNLKFKKVDTNQLCIDLWDVSWTIIFLFFSLFFFKLYLKIWRDISRAQRTVWLCIWLPTSMISRKKSQNPTKIGLLTFSK